MKVLFIYPNLTRQEYLSLGIAYLSSYLKKKGHQTYLMDYTFGGDVQDCLEKIKKVKPDIIGFSLRSGEFKFSLKVANKIKRKFDIPIIFGGVHSTVAPEETISKKPVDMICIGEAELALGELLNKMEKRKDYTKTRNFWFKKNSQTIKNLPRPLLQNLDSLPFPDRELFDFERYLNCRNGAVDILIGRGCPFNCTYCINHALQKLYKNKGRYVRTRSVNNVLEEIRNLTKKYQVNYLSFQDDVFGIDKKWVKEFSKKYSKEFKAPFSCNLRPEMVTKELCKDLKKAGCTTLNIGIESGSEKLRENILNRYNSNEDIKRSFGIAKKAGLATYSFNMLGLPFETDSDLQKTIELNQQIKPDFLQASIFQPYPGTKLRKVCKKKGWISKKDIPISHKTDPILSYPKRSARKIKRQKQFFRYHVLKKSNLKKALLILAFDLNEGLFTKLRDKIPVPIKKVLFGIDISLRTRKSNGVIKHQEAPKEKRSKPKIYFRLSDPRGGANIIFENLIKYFNKKEIKYVLDYLPGFPNIMPVFYTVFKNKGQGYNIVHKDAFTSFYADNKPTLITVYHLPETPYYQKYASLIHKLYYKIVYLYHHRALINTNIVVCTSRYTKKQLEIVHGYKEAVVIHCGVDTNLFKPLKVGKENFGIDKEKTVLLYTGNLIKRKGADLLPKIIEKLDDDFVLLLTAGMRNQTINKGRNIIFLGRLPFNELVKVYNVADILLFPTRLEGFGYTVAEAMACSKPVVTANCSSLPELVVNGKGGFLCEIENVDDFVAKIKVLAADKNLRKEMGKFNRKRVLEKFTLERMAKEYLKLYQQLIKEEQ